MAVVLVGLMVTLVSVGLMVISDSAVMVASMVCLMAILIMVAPVMDGKR